MTVSVTYSQSFINLMLTLKKEEIKVVGDFVALLKSSGFSSLP